MSYLCLFSVATTELPRWCDFLKNRGLFGLLGLEAGQTKVGQLPLVKKAFVLDSQLKVEKRGRAREPSLGGGLALKQWYSQELNL